MNTMKSKAIDRQATHILGRGSEKNITGLEMSC